MELSAEDIETLRSAERALYNRPGLQDLIKSMADRLSPPEPEQPDEATKIWREMRARGADEQGFVRIAAQYRGGDIDLMAPSVKEISYLRQVLSELAALHAENERLKGEALQKSHGNRIVYDMKMPPYPYQTPNIGGSLSVRVKAAARNPAGPGPWPGDPDHRETMPVDTAPVVEVTVDSGMDAEAVEQAELFWAQLPVNRKWISIPTHEKALVCHLLSTYRTEAEARGRREALDEALNVVSDYADGFRAAYYIDPIIDELKRLMTEGK